ncbi:MAG: peptidoglycan-binding protein [Leptolyngbyaceae cyanobacterium CRU_2_3]|nr:peptidoglycan-binding protein [Leptolyngbyaceae cyanobacterium CRU_2_3]
MKLPAHYGLLNFRIACRVSLVSLLLLSTIFSTVRPALAQVTTPLTLRLNDSGDSVAELQRQLLNLGHYNGEITGFYGPMTQAAVARFQETVGLTADGVVGSATQSALQSGSVSSATGSTPQSLVRLGDSGDQIAELQKRLADLGYYSGSISGSFDLLTEEAVSRFQQAQGLPADGIVGPATEVALRQPTGQAVPSGNSLPSAIAPLQEF